MSSYAIDLHHPNPAPLVTGRTVLFLDSSIWIRLARSRPPEAATAADEIRTLVRAGRLVCPISWPIFSELLNHSWESALPIARCMDEFSLGLAYANDTELFAAEIANFVVGLVGGAPTRLRPERLYVPISGSLGTHAVITWPAEFPAPADEQHRLTREFEKRIRARTLTAFIDGARDHLPRPELHTDDDLDYHRAWNERFSVAKGNRSVMRRIELEYEITTMLLPGIQNCVDQLSFLDRLTFHARLTALPLDEHERVATAILEHLPALRTKIEIMAAMGFNPHRKGTMQDFYDAEIMIAPLAYADAFAAHDKWIKHLLTKDSTILQNNRVRYLQDVPTLLAYLQELG